MMFAGLRGSVESLASVATEHLTMNLHGGRLRSHTKRCFVFVFLEVELGQG